MEKNERKKEKCEKYCYKLVTCAWPPLHNGNDRAAPFLLHLYLPYFLHLTSSSSFFLSSIPFFFFFFLLYTPFPLIFASLNCSSLLTFKVGSVLLLLILIWNKKKWGGRMITHYNWSRWQIFFLACISYFTKLRVCINHHVLWL